MQITPAHQRPHLVQKPGFQHGKKASMDALVQHPSVGRRHRKLRYSIRKGASLVCLPLGEIGVILDTVLATGTGAVCLPEGGNRLSGQANDFQGPQQPLAIVGVNQPRRHRVPFLQFAVQLVPAPVVGLLLELGPQRRIRRRQRGRAGQPAEVAPAFVFLASERDASYVSGTVLGVTGGKPVF